MALLSAAACAANPGPGQSGYPYNLDGSYTGRVFFAGDPFDATMELDTRGGGSVEGSFRVRVPVRIDGEVEGVVVGDLFRAQVRYMSPGGCNGSMEGVLSITEGGDTFEGPVTVRDCGEPIAGRLAFERGGEDEPERDDRSGRNEELTRSEALGSTEEPAISEAPSSSEEPTGDRGPREDAPPCP